MGIKSYTQGGIDIYFYILYNCIMQTKKEQIIKMWETLTRRPSYQEIADELKTAKGYVFQVIKDYRHSQDKKRTTGQIDPSK